MENDPAIAPEGINQDIFDNLRRIYLDKFLLLKNDRQFITDIAMYIQDNFNNKNA